VKNKRGFSVLEVILASAMFTVFAAAAVVGIISGYNANRLGREVTIAGQFAAEGLEAVRSIRNQGFRGLVNSSQTGLTNLSGLWAFSGTSNTLDSGRYLRRISVLDGQKNVNGEVVASGGVVYSNLKKVVSAVSWNFTSTRPESINLTTYLTNWRNPRNALIIYGDGGTSSDAISYRILDGANGFWNTPALANDIDTSSTNRALRVAKLYSSFNRDEKILISRHYNAPFSIFTPRYLTD